MIMDLFFTMDLCSHRYFNGQLCYLDGMAGDRYSLVVARDIIQNGLLIPWKKFSGERAQIESRQIPNLVRRIARFRNLSLRFLSAFPIILFDQRSFIFLLPSRCGKTYQMVQWSGSVELFWSHHQICIRHERNINIKKKTFNYHNQFLKHFGARLEMNVFKFKTMIEKQNFCF